jgi:iron-sulfur cluster repair protein YtfE (RIC family)
MFVRPAPRGPEGPPDLVELLLECHARIRRFIALARTVAARPDASPEDTREACERVQRYFTEALPLHVADEEESVLPRLRGQSPQVDDALALMAGQHAAHAEPLQSMLQAAAALGLDRDDAQARGALLATAARLEAEFEEHLALEEAALFPALRALPLATQAELVGELRRRRQPPG